MSAPPRGSPHSVTVTVHSSLSEVRTEWDELAIAADNVFGTWEWADAWHRHLAPGATLRILLARRSDGSPLALLPLYLARRRGLKVVRIIGAGPADELGIVCAEADRRPAAQALAGHVRDLLGGSGIFLGERLRGDQAPAALLHAELMHRNSSPVLPIAERSFDDFLASRSRNFRSQVRRRERRLEREHGLRFRLTEDPAQLEHDMRTLIALHRARWGDRASTAFAGGRSAFHLDFARAALQRGWLRLWTMELDGAPAAAWYGLRYGRNETYYQSGRDPRLSDRHVGFVLLCHTIRCAFDDGLREYRFGLGDEEYKERFAERDPGLETVVIATGAGRAGAVLMRAVLRLPPRYRRGLRRRLAA